MVPFAVGLQHHAARFDDERPGGQVVLLPHAGKIGDKAEDSFHTRRRWAAKPTGA